MNNGQGNWQLSNWRPNPNMALICSYLAADAYLTNEAPINPFIADWSREIPKDKDGKITKELNGADLLTLRAEDFHLNSYGSSHATNYLKDFFARCYQNIHTNEIVISYRGTNSFGNFIADLDIGIKGWNARWNAYDDAALAFYHLVINTIPKPTMFPAPIWITGHSLGGYLAQIVASQYPSSTVAIVFNAPDVGGLKLLNHQRIKNHYSNIFKINSSLADLIHDFGGNDVGEQFNFPVGHSCLKKFWEYPLCQHAIDTVLAQTNKYPSQEQTISKDANTVFQEELESALNHSY